MWGALTSYTCVTGNGETDLILNDISLAGEQIYIRVFGFNDSYGGNFDLMVLEPAQDYCAEAMYVETTSDTEEFKSYTNKYASMSFDGGSPTCGNYLGCDIWFTMDVPGNGKLTLDSRAWAGYTVKPVFSIYTGSCTSLAEYDCAFFNSTNTFGAKIQIDDPALANETIFLRMFNYGSNTGGAFDLSIHNPAPLPVELIHFRADAFNTDVLLDWATASEENNDYFLVEHSIDGSNYTPVGHVDGRGTTDIEQQYSYKHAQPYFGNNYYRLKQVDHDGAYEYSPVVIVTIELEEEHFQVFPNPALTKGLLTLRWVDQFRENDLQVSVTDAMGRQVFVQEVRSGSDPETIIDCRAAKLDAGIYYVQLSSHYQVIAHRRFNLIKD